MKYQRTIFPLLVTLLVVQVVSLNPSIPVPHYEQGGFVENVKSKSIEFRQRIEQTLFSAKSTRQYESIIFTGDVMLGRNVEVLMRREGNEYPFKGISLSSLAPNAAVVGNFESAMSIPHIPTPALQMKFSVDDVFLSTVEQAGFTHFSQANNHALDYGESGFLTTNESLKRRGIVPFGQGNVLNEASISYLESDGKVVAIIGLNTTARIPSREEVTSVFTKAAQHSQMQIAYIHWGTEYELVHSRSQELFAKELVKAGADLVIGHHPHVVQDIAIVDGVVVCYSLGNFVFDQYFSKEVQEGLVLSLTLDSDPRLLLIPVSSVETKSQPTFMKNEEHIAFLDDLAIRSDKTLFDHIKVGVIPLRTSVATSTKMAMIVQ
jgi:hypothetical protein